ncbi:hypothetical protein ACLB2K_018636 [Fragaria x ananassa]
MTGSDERLREGGGVGGAGGEAESAVEMIREAKRPTNALIYKLIHVSKQKAEINGAAVSVPCSADEHSALLQFKQSFVINTSVSSSYYASGVSFQKGYPKTLSWKSNTSCCSWDGITCDEETGHVIGLDLSGSCLYGSINSSSSLFRLVHLESLNLAHNDFNSSQIPPTIRNFPRLRHLNFSYSGFSGRVPSEISHLSKLSSLSIERNYSDTLMFSHKGFLRSLAQNLTRLETLRFSYIDISSSIPDTLTNLSHLTSLVLSNCSLSGKLPFSLGNLRHLFYLDISLNNISGQIPPSFGNLTRLTDLELYSNQLSGFIPASLGNLSQLTTLRLYSNQLSGPILASLGYLTRITLLRLGSNQLSGPIPPSFGNLSQITILRLASNQLSGPIPPSFGNLTRLTTLWLDSNQLSGSIPVSLGNLTRLTDLELDSNQLSGPIPPSFGNLTQLTTLWLYSNQLSGPIPVSLGNLTRLTTLWLDSNQLSGPIPPSFGNLSQITILRLASNQLSGPIPHSFGNLSQLTILWLTSNQLSGPIPPSFGNLSQLTILRLDSNQLSGPIPASLGNLTRLTDLELDSNQLSGPIPHFFGNLTRLTELWLGTNNFNSSIPPSLFNLVNLRSLDLTDNTWSGTTEFHKFLKLQNLTDLRLSGNKLEVLMGSTSMNNATIVVPKFENLLLRGCNISEFPDFLRSQDSLSWLDLSGNGLHGRVPKWMWNTSTQTLTNLDISHNFLSGFDRPPSTIPWVNLEILDLASNSLVGEIPSLICNLTKLYYLDLSDNRLSGVLPQCLRVSSNDLQYLYLRNNNLTGKVSPQICNLTKLYYLDLSSNKLSGMLPQCLGPGLQYLKLANNSFHGILPQRFTTAGCDLSMIDVSHNKLQGQLPRSLAYCASLEFLVLSNNQFDDVFPLWLGTLQKLKILAMRHNGFYGVIGQPKKNLHFPELRILDLSYNSFRGKFPAEYIFSGNTSRGITSEQGSYDHSYDHYLQCSISITNKGIEINYPKIQEDLVAIHLSGNKFEGNIPEFLGKLKGLRLLNISNNFFTGCIPSSFGNLRVLESLDLSQNQLSGVIPQQLSQLFFLEKFNVSHNNLTGRIPGGTQLSTFDVTSFEGNPGLCGDPLPKKCENIEGINLPPSITNPEGSGIEVDWKFALAGLGSGLVVGVVLADVAITRWDEWFLEIVDMLIRLMKRMRRFRN